MSKASDLDKIKALLLEAKELADKNGIFIATFTQMKIANGNKRGIHAHVFGTTSDLYDYWPHISRAIVSGFRFAYENDIDEIKPIDSKGNEIHNNSVTQ